MPTYIVFAEFVKWDPRSMAAKTSHGLLDRPKRRRSIDFGSQTHFPNPRTGTWCFAGSITMTQIRTEMGWIRTRLGPYFPDTRCTRNRFGGRVQHRFRHLRKQSLTKRSQAERPLIRILGKTFQTNP